MGRTDRAVVGLAMAGLGYLYMLGGLFTFSDPELLFGFATGLGLLQAAWGIKARRDTGEAAFLWVGLALVGLASVPDFWDATGATSGVFTMANLFEGTGFLLAGAAGLLWARDADGGEERAVRLLSAGCAVAAVTHLLYLTYSAPRLDLMWLPANILAAAGLALAAVSLAATERVWEAGGEAARARATAQATKRR